MARIDLAEALRHVLASPPWTGWSIASLLMADGKKDGLVLLDEALGWPCLDSLDRLMIERVLEEGVLAKSLRNAKGEVSNFQVA
jgi:hypothetical protein